MTTLKPQLIRADTLDLQDQDAPSAKDHTRQPTHPAPYGAGPAAPHQSQALRSAEHQAQQEQKYSPVVSPRHSDERMRGKYPDEAEFYDDHEDDEQHEQLAPHEHLVGELDHESGIEEVDMGDQGDDDSEDDMMDKISSSPSIDDGKYALPIVWPPRRDSMLSGATHFRFLTPTRGKQCSSSPFTSTPKHVSLSIVHETVCYPGSHQGRYPGFSEIQSADPDIASEDTIESSLRQVTPLALYDSKPTQFEDHLSNLDVEDVSRYLLPVNDPLLDSSFDDVEEDTFSKDCDNDLEWEDVDDNALLEIETNSDDDTGNFPFTSDARFIDSGWGGECLREIEDIDFEFVYALHTFVATVEGQANATKGDTMVLLDDSNSYWWLVRVVQDGSIGYLPAEHIETPTERLARLNKRRNVDLSATMLGDNPEKSKNPLKKAMRRRNAKTVQFAAPQYFEPSDFDYSDEEDEGQERQAERSDGGLQGQDQDAQQGSGTEPVAVAPLQINTQQTGPITNGIHRIQSDESINSDQAASPEKELSSEVTTVDEVQDDSNIRPRNRAVRNTDSFYKDDSVETKKISLTPRLLRGDSDANTTSEQSEARQPSLETFDRIVAADIEKPKDDKKKKEKKGMLSGFFKRKDKKAKPGESEVDETEKISDDSSRVSPQARESQESLSGRLATSPQRQTSKLQKQPPIKGAAKISPVQDGMQPRETLSTTTTDPKSSASQQAPNLQNTVRTVDPGQSNGQEGYGDQNTTQQNVQAQSISPDTSPVEKKSFFSPISTALRSSPSHASLEGESAVKPVYAKKAKHRFEIDAADSEDEMTPTTAKMLHQSISPLDSGRSPSQQPDPRRELPIEAPKNPPPPPPSQQPPLLVDTSASEPPSLSPPSPSQSSSPSLVDVDTANDVDQSTNDTTTSPRAGTYTPSTTRSTPTWSDVSLRNYMDNDQDIRDLLIIVHDKSNVVPAGPDHPMIGNLFTTEKGRLAEMQATLDSMLTSWLSRKNSTLLSR